MELLNCCIVELRKNMNLPHFILHQESGIRHHITFSTNFLSKIYNQLSNIHLASGIRHHITFSTNFLSKIYNQLSNIHLASGIRHPESHNSFNIHINLTIYNPPSNINNKSYCGLDMELKAQSLG